MKIWNNKKGLLTKIHRGQLCFIFAKWTCITLAGLLLSFFLFYKVDLNAHVFVRESFASIEVNKEPLYCFSNHTAIQQHAIIIPTAIDEDTCFDYASLIHPNATTVTTSTLFHTLLIDKLFTKRHFDTIQSFLLTQPSSQLTLWITRKEQLDSPHWKALSDKDNLQYRIISMADLTTSFDSISPSSELLPLLILYQHGGVWFNMDTLFIRDLAPLLDQEWMSQGSCHETKSKRFTGPLMHFSRRSAYLCEMIQQASRVAAVGPSLYSHVYDQCIMNGVKPWTVLPWCYMDPSGCSTGVSRLYSLSELDKSKLLKAFVYHLRPFWKGYFYDPVYDYLTSRQTVY